MFVDFLRGPSAVLPRMRGAWAIAAVALSAAAGAAHAQTPAGAGAQAGTAAVSSAAAPRASEVGHAESGWLEMQRSNRYAAHEQPMLGAAATLAYQRYLESFKHPIPESFASKLSGGGGSGGGSQ